MNFQTFSQVAFAFRVTPSLLALGLVWSLAWDSSAASSRRPRGALPISQALSELY